MGFISALHVSNEWSIFDSVLDSVQLSTRITSYNEIYCHLLDFARVLCDQQAVFLSDVLLSWLDSLMLVDCSNSHMLERICAASYPHICPCRFQGILGVCTAFSYFTIWYPNNYAFCEGQVKPAVMHQECCVSSCILQEKKTSWFWLMLQSKWCCHSWKLSFTVWFYAVIQSAEVLL